jgi:hypothetical protein
MSWDDAVVGLGSGGEDRRIVLAWADIVIGE